jgi:large subunit ribosomal protein L20
MPRVKGGPTHARKRKRVLKRASGFVASPGTQYRSALEFIRRADRYAYRDRRQRRRHFRQLWITRLGAALRARGINYNRFIPAAIAAGIELNRKMLSELAIADPTAFDAIVELARPHLHKHAPKPKPAKPAAA